MTEAHYKRLIWRQSLSRQHNECQKWNNSLTALRQRWTRTKIFGPGPAQPSPWPILKHVVQDKGPEFSAIWRSPQKRIPIFLMLNDFIIWCRGLSRHTGALPARKTHPFVSHKASASNNKSFIMLVHVVGLQLRLLIVRPINLIVF